jgi:hypothetical protein
VTWSKSHDVKISQASSACRKLRGVIWSYKELKEVIWSYKELKEAIRSYKEL